MPNPDTVHQPEQTAALALTRRGVPAPPRRARALDRPGQLLAVAALALAAGALVEAGPLGWTSAPVLAGLAASALAGAGFVAAERRSPDPMLPLGLLRRAAFRSGTAVGLLINLGFYGQLFVLSLLFQDGRGYSALRAGLALFPEAALPIAASTLSGALMARTGPRRPMLAGLVIGGAGLLGLALAGPHAGYPLLVAPMAAAGFGMALTMPAATASVLEAAPADRSGIASGVVNAARQAGGVLGVALLGTLVSGSFTRGLPVALLVAAAAFGTGAVLVLMGGRGSAERGSTDPRPG
jgi:DHA2 family methylenomycin A resistance protein-like MFS transporter